MDVTQISVDPAACEAWGKYGAAVRLRGGVFR